MRLTGSGGGHVEVVGGPAAGEGHVEEPAVLTAREDGVGGVDGDALGAVDGGGVAELEVAAREVVAGQVDGPPQLLVPEPGGSIGVDLLDGPPVSVLDPVGGTEPDGAQVPAGDDGVAGARCGRRPAARAPVRLAGRRGAVASRWARARMFNSATSSRVGASRMVSRPASRSLTQASKARSAALGRRRCGPGPGRGRRPSGGGVARADREGGCGLGCCRGTGEPRSG